MVLVSYDISSDKVRTKFSKHLEKYGHRIQYSLYEIDNSDRILRNVITDIEGRFSKIFGETDSVYIIKLSQNCSILRYGYAKHEEEDYLIV